MSDVVKMLLQVSPHLRPSCDRLLSNPIIGRRIERYFPDGEIKQGFLKNDSNNVLMQTIKIPKNLLYLSDRLPKPSYHSPKRTTESSADATDEDERKFILGRNTSDAKLPAILPNSGIHALKQAQ